MHNKILELLRGKHGDDLNLADDVYYLFMKDAVINVYLDEEEKTLKMEVEMLPEDDTYIYYDKELSVESLME